MRKTFMRVLLILTLATTFAASCKPVRNDSQVKIVNGQSVAQDGPVRSSTVGLVTLKSDGTRDQVFCTAVIVAPDALITATQCLDSATNAAVKWGVLLDHPNLPAPRIMAVKSTQPFAASGSRDYPSLNLSVIRLITAIDPTSDYKPAEILRNPAGLQAGTEVLIAGYGRQTSKCLDATRCNGVLLEAKSTVESFHDAQHLLSTVLIRARQDQGSVCFGDAGGPAFVQINGEYFLAGLANGSLRRGLSELSAGKNEAPLCENGLASFTFPGDYLSWMERRAGVVFEAPRAGNLPRSSNPALENTGASSRPVNSQNWTEWLAFSQHLDPAFGTVSQLLQKLLTAEQLRTDAKLSELDFFLRPHESAQRAQSLTSLVLKPEGAMPPLTSLEPLAAFTGLTQLEIEGMAVTDFSPLALLSNLTSLKITGNRATGTAIAALPKMESLASLSRLQSLELDQVGTESLRGVDASKLLALRTLTLVGNGQPLFIPKAPALDTLIISNADLSNPDLLVGLPASLTTVKITGSKLSAAGFVSSLVNLKTLDLSGNQISDFSRVADLRRLAVVIAVGNPAVTKVCGTPAAALCEYDLITNPLSLEEYCINFVYQDSGKVYAAAIEALSLAALVPTPKNAAGCADLHSKLRLKRKLELVGTGVAGPVDMSPVASIRSLNNLSLRSFGVVDVRPLARLVNLDILDLSQNVIVDAKALETLPELVELNLAKNSIADMKGFTHPKLKRLTLDSNLMTSVQSLGDIPELRFLSLAHMPGFKDVKGIGSKFGKLKNLNVSKTDVTDLQTLEPAVGLAIDAPEAAVKNGCPVLLGSCVTDSATPVSRSGPVPGLKPGERVQANPTAEVNLPGLSLSIKLE